jgi:cytochrome P450
MADQQPGGFDYDPFAPEVMANPLPFYEVLRREHPVYYSAKYDGFFFSRFDDVVEMLDYVDNSLLATESSLPMSAHLAGHHNEAAPPVPPLDPFPMAQQLGQPVYGEVRRAHGKPLRPNAVAAMRDFVRQLVDDHLDRQLPKGRFDLIKDFTGPVSASVILHLFDMPLELADQALDLVNAGSRRDGAYGKIDPMEAAARVVAFYAPYVKARADAGHDGSVPLIDGMFDLRIEGRSLTLAEITPQLVCAFIGGVETTPKIVGAGLMELEGHPDQLAEVRTDLATNVPKAAEEIMRYCAPAQWFMRTAHKPVTVAGQLIKPGQRAFYLVASALRDERQFDEPSRFVWNRPIERVLSFGHGIHYCIGVHLARMEVQVMLQRFLERVPRYRIDRAGMVRYPSSFQWGWNEIPVEIG